VARGLFPSFQGDVRLVELASLSDPGLVPSAVAGGVSLKLGGDQISAESVARAIGAQKLLLVLDNCEHVIDAAARLAETVIRMCPQTTILATSREILNIEGEHVYRVPPLDVPPQHEEEAKADQSFTLPVVNGLAIDWPQYSKGKFDPIQRKAEHVGRGMWAGSYVEPWRYRVCIRAGGSPSNCSDDANAHP
jgi:hypothetical protein